MSVLKEAEHLRLSLNEIELATNNFNESIGEGGYGMVYKGELRISGRPTTVAVKTLGDKSLQGLKQFLTEIQLLTSQNHKNVISLLGFCEEGKHKSLVYEYAARGSLDNYLGVRVKTNLSWQKRLEICLDAARGLNHLHTNSRNKQTIIHRDIKSANILLDDNWVAKIADLGLSKLNLEESNIVSDPCGTHGYCDPGYYDGILKKEYDVYSFGIVLFEVLCGRRCNFQYKKDGFVLSGASVQKYYEENKMKEIIDPCLREEMSLYSINKFSEVAYKCLLKDERQRPSMDRIVKELEELLLIQAIEVESLKSNSCSSDPIRKLRYEKVRRIFGRFDVNRDGVLNKKELAYFFHLLGQHMDGTLTKIEHMNLMETKQGFKHKYFGPRALRKYHGKLEKFTLPIKNLYRTWVPSTLSEREIAKIIDTIFSFFGESTNGEIGLTRDGMLRFYDYGVDDLHDHFEFLRLDYKPFDNDEDSFQTMERYEKVKRIFQRCDINKDGYLDILDLLGFIVINSQEIELQFNRVKHIFHWCCLFIEGDKGLDCDGLFKFYNSGIDSLDDDFEKLNLKLKPLEEHELTLRYEKVRRIFQRFDINEDGGLDEDELMEYIVFKRSPEVKNDEEANSMLAGHIFSLLREFTKGEKGLTCDGFLLGYEFSVDGLDDDFKKLRLDLKPLDDREDALRKRERAEKVRIMFERFDLNGDGGLDKQELGSLLLKRNPHKEARKEVPNYVDKVFRWYAEYIDGDKGLTCDGLLRTYDHGIDSLDVDFETLGLELRKSVETEDASRKRVRSEKVEKILKRFDFNGDGGLNRKEMAFYLAAVHPEDKLSEEEMTFKVNHMFQILGEFVDGVIGLSCDGLIRKYDYGEDNLDAHFKILKLR